MTVTPPSLDAVEAAAAASPLIATLGRFREWLGPEGRELSEAGGLLFDDSHVLAALLGIEVFTELEDDAADGPYCSDLQPRFNLAFAVAEDCGAITVRGNRVLPVTSYDREDPMVQAAVALSTLIELGPMRTSQLPGDQLLDLRDAVVDALLVHWLVTLLPAMREQRVDHFVNWAVDACREQLGGDPCTNEGGLETWVDNGVCYLFDALHWAGAVEWSDRTLHRATLDFTARWFGGGTVRITDLGRHVIPDHLADAGLKLRPAEDIGSMASATALFGDLLMTEGDDARGVLVDAWRRDLDDTERARLVAAALLDAAYSPTRIVGFEVLERIGPDAAAPFVRQLLDSPSSEDAARFLVGHGLAGEEELRPFLGLGPLIDVIASVAGDPARLNAWMVHLLEGVEEPALLLEVIACYTRQEATMVLTAAARHVTDPRFAELICAAEQLHHEVLAEADPAA